MYVYGYVPLSTGTLEGQKRALDPTEDGVTGSCEALSMGVRGQLRSSAKTVCTLNH